MEWSTTLTGIGTFDGLIKAIKKKSEWLKNHPKITKIEDLSDEKKKNRHIIRKRLHVLPGFPLIVQPFVKEKIVAVIYQCIIDYQRELVEVECYNEGYRHLLEFDDHTTLCADQTQIKENINLKIKAKIAKGINKKVEQGVAEVIIHEMKENNLLAFLPKAPFGILT